MRNFCTLVTGILGAVGIAAIALFTLHAMGVEQVGQGVDHTLELVDDLLGIRVKQ